MNVSGTVSNVSSRDVNTKFGLSKAWAVALVGQDGFHGFGFKKPEVKKGDKVTFSSEKNAKGYLMADVDTLVVVPGTDEVSSGGSVGAVQGDSKPGYWDAKALRDIANDLERKVGATRNTAIEWVKFLIANGAFPKVPTGPKLEEFYNSLLDSYMVKFGVDIPTTDAAPVSKAKVKAAPVVSEKEEEENDDWN